MAKQRRDRKKDITTLQASAWCYAVALFEHCDPSKDGFDVDAFNYISSQCDYVRCNAEAVLEFLLKNDLQGEVSYKHLQYFFAIRPHVYEPYMKLWWFVFEQLDNEGTLPPNAEVTLRRLLAAGQNTRRFLNK